MTTLAAIVLFTLLGGVLSAAIAGLFLLLPERRRVQSLPHMVSFATGALLGAALLALVPHAIMGAGLFKVHSIGVALVAGIGVFFVLEKFLLWRHCHSEDYETHEAHEHHRRQASGVLVLAGDALHNTLDGVLIAAAFLTDFHLGVVTALAIMAHEIPQEVGNFAVLLHSGMSREPRLRLEHRDQLHRGDRRRAGLLRAARGARLAALCAGDRGGQPAVRGGRGPDPGPAPALRHRGEPRPGRR